MMHSWASRSRCCAWEACSESSSGVVHPAEPKVASSWGPVTQTQGMESQSAQPFPLWLSIYPSPLTVLCTLSLSTTAQSLKNKALVSGTAVDFKPVQQSGANWGLETQEQR